jgi:hypothetical protein
VNCESNMVDALALVKVKAVESRMRRWRWLRGYAPWGPDSPLSYTLARRRNGACKEGVQQTYTGASPSPQERKEPKLHPGTKREEELGEGRKQDSLCPPCSEK